MVKIDYSGISEGRLNPSQLFPFPQVIIVQKCYCVTVRGADSHSQSDSNWTEWYPNRFKADPSAAGLGKRLSIRREFRIWA
jgi:hypothetical protein